MLLGLRPVDGGGLAEDQDGSEDHLDRRRRLSVRLDLVDVVLVQRVQCRCRCLQRRDCLVEVCLSLIRYRLCLRLLLADLLRLCRHFLLLLIRHGFLLDDDDQELFCLLGRLGDLSLFHHKHLRHLFHFLLCLLDLLHSAHVLVHPVLELLAALGQEGEVPSHQLEVVGGSDVVDSLQLLLHSLGHARHRRVRCRHDLSDSRLDFVCSQVRLLRELQRNL
mmetsp:Transcript_1956/g.4393  ORF Transcript_1956/g.4393 Transcript_1956/m.4393 type:complete len:220 (-) Transcript_1956:2259-2918(-)